MNQTVYICLRQMRLGRMLPPHDGPLNARITALKYLQKRDILERGNVQS